MTPSCLALSPITGILFIFYIIFLLLLFLITCTLKHDDSATALTTTLLTEVEENYSSGLVEIDLSLFAEISKYSYFV